MRSGSRGLPLVLALMSLSSPSSADAEPSVDPISLRNTSQCFLESISAQRMDTAADAFFVPKTYDAAHAAAERRGLAQSLRALDAEFGRLGFYEPFIGVAATVNVALMAGSIQDMATGAIPSQSFRLRYRARFGDDLDGYITVEFVTDGETSGVKQVLYEVDAMAPGAIARMQAALRRLQGVASATDGTPGSATRDAGAIGASGHH